MRGIATLGQVAGWLFLVAGTAVFFVGSMAAGVGLVASGIAYLLLAHLLEGVAVLIDEARAARSEAMQRAGWVPVQGAQGRHG